MQQQKPSQQPMAGKRSRGDGHASASTASNGNSWNTASARQDGEHTAGDNGRDLARKENATDFLRDRFKRHNPGKTVASGSDSATQGKGFPSIAAALTPAESSLLKTLTTDGAGGNCGVAGVSGLDRLMRVMINAPDKEARALCLELLLRSKDDAEVMKGFVERRGLTFIKGWLAETTSVAMIKLLLSVAKILPVTYSSLKQSDAVRSLKALNKHADPVIKKQSKAVITHWKSALVIDEGEIAKQRRKLDALHDNMKAKQEAAKKAKEDAEKVEKQKKGAMRARDRPPNGTDTAAAAAGPLIITAPPAPLLYTRSSSANSSMDSDSGVSLPSKAIQRVVDNDPLAAITGTVPRIVPGTGSKSGPGTAAASSAGASTGTARFFPGKKFPPRGVARGGGRGVGRGAAAAATVGGRGARDRGSGPRGVIGGGAVGRGAAAGAGAGRSGGGDGAAGRGAAAGAGLSGGGGILKISATPSPGNDGGVGASQVSGAARVGGEDIASSAATATTTATLAATTTAMVATVATTAATAATAPGGGADISGKGKPAEVASGGGGESSTGPPTIVSLDEMARADEEEKKRKRKARPAGKKVGWADRAGKTLQVVKEFHPDDAALIVSEAPLEEATGDAMSLLHHHHNSDHKHWVERVKREREMERKFHGKAGGRSRRGGHQQGNGDAGNDMAAEEASRRKAMVPAVSWRRPGPYQEGVVHEFVMTLEVESGEAESQAARTRAGLEVVYLSSGDIPPSPAEPDAASFLPVDDTTTYKIPFYMEAEVEQMQADKEQQLEQEQQQQQHPQEEQRQHQSPSPPPPRLTYEQMKALEGALATVDPHAATALRSRFSQEPRLLQALLVTEGRVNTALLRSLCQQALSTPSNVHLTLPTLPPATTGASSTGQQQLTSTTTAVPGGPTLGPGPGPVSQYPQQSQLPPPPPPRHSQPTAVPYVTTQAVAPVAPAPLAQPTPYATGGGAGPTVIIGAPLPPPPPPPPLGFAAVGPPQQQQQQAVPIQHAPLHHQPAFFPVQTPGTAGAAGGIVAAAGAPAGPPPQGMGIPQNPPPPPPPVLYHQQIEQQPLDQQQQRGPAGMTVPGQPLGMDAQGPGFGREGPRDGWEGRGGRGRGGGRGGLGGRRDRDGDRGRHFDDKGRTKPVFCRYHNAKVQMCTNDPCRFIHDLNHFPDEQHRPRMKSYATFAMGGRDSGDRDRDRDRRDWDRRDRDRGERRDRKGERDNKEGGGGGGAGGGDDKGEGGRAGAGGRSDSRDRSDGRGNDEKRTRYR